MKKSFKILLLSMLIMFSYLPSFAQDENNDYGLEDVSDIASDKEKKDEIINGSDESLQENINAEDKIYEN